MSARRSLCIALRFRPEPSPDAWLRTFSALLHWEPALAPSQS